MEKMKLYWPLLSPSIQQGFGANFVWHSRLNGGRHPEWDGKLFYGGVIPGLSGHNGLDMAGDMAKVYAAHAGKVRYFRQEDGFMSIVYSAPDGTWGVEVIYGHLDRPLVEVGQEVSAGQLVAISDNRGPYTTGAHLHFMVFPLRPDHNGLLSRYDLDNGYGGAVDPTPYMVPWGVLAKATGASQVYQLVGNTKRPIADKLALFSIGASGYDPVIEVEPSQLNAFPSGKPVTYAYQDLTLTPEQVKDLMRTFTENPSEAQEIYGKYF